MKHLDRSAAISKLLQWSADSGIKVNSADASLLLDHLEWLLETNLSVNLTSIDEPAEALRLHIWDSLLALPEVIESPPGMLVDIGTGGGFPGLPLAVVSGRPAVLLDSVGKKASALSTFVSGRLSSVEVRGERAEDYSTRHHGSGSVVVARAVAPLPSLVELASPLLRAGGRLVCLKGAPDDDELRRGDEAALITGMGPSESRHALLPDGSEERTIVSYIKRGNADFELPRRVGRAQKRPLA